MYDSYKYDDSEKIRINALEIALNLTNALPGGIKSIELILYNARLIENYLQYGFTPKTVDEISSWSLTNLEQDINNYIAEEEAKWKQKFGQLHE